MFFTTTIRQRPYKGYCVYAFTKAQEFCFTTPLPGQKQQDDTDDIPY